MLTISRSMLLAAGLLAFPVAGAMAQRDNGGGAPLQKSATGNSGNAVANGNTPGGTGLRTETSGGTGQKVTPPAQGDSSSKGVSTGPSAKQPQ